MTFLFIALKPSGRFIARITFQSVCILKIISVLPFGMFNTVVVARENKLTYGLCLAWKVLK